MFSWPVRLKLLMLSVQVNFHNCVMTRRIQVFNLKDRCSRKLAPYSNKQKLVSLRVFYSFLYPEISRDFFHLIRPETFNHVTHLYWGVHKQESLSLCRFSICIISVSCSRPHWERKKESYSLFCLVGIPGICGTEAPQSSCLMRLSESLANSPQLFMPSDRVYL